MDHDIWKYGIWGGGALLAFILIFMVGPWVHEAWANRNEPDFGASEEWADPDTGELGQIVKEVSFDRSLGKTQEVNMHDLRTKLDLEDIEIYITRRSNEVLGSIIELLENDEAWKRFTHKGRHRKDDVQVV